mmetsp:Transcript_17401/g.47516  ORF Transcript_17401/g.47516 Transcript_17401/m.47516 type:complete len:84 (-) Transcript_17401:14-265(-)
MAILWKLSQNPEERKMMIDAGIHQHLDVLILKAFHSPQLTKKCVMLRLRTMQDHYGNKTFDNTCERPTVQHFDMFKRCNESTA